MIYCHVKVRNLRWFKFRRKPMTVEEIMVSDLYFAAMLEFRKRVKAAAKAADARDEDGIEKYADT